MRWIEEWLRNRTSVVHVNGQTSHEFMVHSGVPQGSVLGPLLFLLYINDITEYILHAECRLYADDTLLCMNIGNKGSSALQHNIDTLAKWSDTWHMKFNPNKCEHMTLTTKSRTKTDLKLNGVTISKTDSLKYLGVSIHSSLKWSNHVTIIEKKANKTLGMLRRCLNGASSKTQLLAFNTVVRPILEYACQVWSPHQSGLCERLEKILRRAVRWAYRILKYESVTDVMERHGISSLSCRRQILDKTFIEKAQLGHFGIHLGDYITSNGIHNTRGKTTNPHFNTDQFKFSYYNRMRPYIKVKF